MINWRLQKFEQLSAKDLFDVFKLRQQVFILEQQCLYPDIDDKDLIAQHLLGFDNKSDQLYAYMRILPATDDSGNCILGRIATTSSHRGAGLGKILLEEGIRFAQHSHPGCDIKISAQAHLEKFYQRVGFVTCSEPYDEDGIMHIDMLRCTAR